MHDKPRSESEIPTVALVNRHFMRNPYPIFASVRESSSPAVPIVGNGWRQWVVCRYEDVRAALAGRSLERELSKRLNGRSRSLLFPEKFASLPLSLRQGVIDRDGADHARLRALISDDVRHERIGALRSSIRKFATELLDELPIGEPVDLIDRFTFPFAANVIGNIVGIPPDARREFPVYWTSIHTGSSVAEVESAGERMQEFCRNMVAYKRGAPGDDMLTRLVRAEGEGGLSEDETVSTLANLLIGGMESATVVANGIALLLTHGEELEKLRADMSLLPGCVEEILRYEGPFRLLGPRVAIEEIHLDGVTIPAGELVALSPASANRDPRKFEDPETFDITRSPNPHLGFGHGVHHCVGIHLARLTVSVGLEEFITRFPDSVLDGAWEDLRWRPGPHQRQLQSLPTILHRTAASYVTPN